MNDLLTIVEFWFKDEVKSKWFAKEDAFDMDIRERFLGQYEVYRQRLEKGEVLGLETAQDYLGVVILLDQFPRNMFRNEVQAFATDRLACQVAREAIARGVDKELSKEQCAFLYMPFMHSEDLKDQEYCVELFEAVGNELNLKFAIMHKEIIEQYGRFPHRNAILGRVSTAEEEVYLAKEGAGF